MNHEILETNLEQAEKNIINFWDQNFKSWPAAKFNWFYLKNIYGKALCWLINETEQNHVVGTTVLFPRNFFYKGKTIRAAITGDFGVDKKHRILGPALQLQKAVIKKCDDREFAFLYGFPNKNSEPVQKRAGFKLTGKSERFVKVLKSNDYLKRKIKPQIFAVLIAPIVNAVIRLTDKEHRYSSKFKTELTSKFDARFDRLWEKARQNFQFIGQRDAQFIKWRFADCPYIDYKIYIVADSYDELIGYIVYYHTASTLNIADVLAKDNNESLEYLLAEFLKYARTIEAHAVSVLYMGNAFFREKLKLFNFSERADKRSIVAYANENDQRKEDIFNPQKWYFFEADND